MEGPSLPLIHAVRLAVPVVLSALAASWMLARTTPVQGAGLAAALPAWRPFPALALQPVVFALAAIVADRALGEGAPPPTSMHLLALLLLLAGAAALAVHGAAPLPWVWREIGHRWTRPLVAIALGILAWRAASAAESLWGTLSGQTLRMLGAIMRLSPWEVVIEPAGRTIGVGDFVIEIAPVCSGVDGLGLVALFQASWLSMARRRLRFPRALILLVFGAVAAFAANVLRIAVLLWVGAAGKEELAAGGLHSKLGWILFLGIALGSAVLADRWAWLRKPDAGASAEGGLPASAGFYLAPLLATLATALLTSALSEGELDVFYGLRIVAGLAVVMVMVRGRLELGGRPGPAALAIGAAVGLVWVLVAAPDASAQPQELASMAPAWRLGWLAVRALGSCTVIPLVEELAFRGFLLRWLAAPDFEKVAPRGLTAGAVLLSSLAFGAVHQDFLLGALAGLAFTGAWAIRGRLSDAVLAHVTANVVVALAVIGFGRWSLWF